MPIGRRPYQPTEDARKQVRSLVLGGSTHEIIASVLGITPKTLRKHYRRELDTTKPFAVAQVAGELFRKATSKDHPQSATCAIFFLKTQGGPAWREVKQHEFSGPDGGAIAVEDAGFAELVKDLDADERAQLRTILSRRLNRREEGS